MLIESSPGGSVRITMLSSCQSGCKFCCLEGRDLRSSAIPNWKETERLSDAVTIEDIKNAIRVAKSLNLTNANLTGGEPTLHPKLSECIDLLSQAGLSVAMTTNAEIPPEKFKNYLNTNLSWVIISLHAVEPEQYVNMDLVAQQIANKHSMKDALKYAKTRLEYKFTNIEQTIEAKKNGIIEDVITNSVLLNLNQTRQIISYCNNMGLLPRIQKNLNDRGSSQELIKQVVRDLGAVCIRESRAIGDSSGAGFDYAYIDRQSEKKNIFRLKDFGDIYVEKMCEACPKKSTEFCRERFYGVRIEPGIVRTCIDIDRQNLTTFTPEDFIEQIDLPNTVPANILKQYQEIQKHKEAVVVYKKSLHHKHVNVDVAYKKTLYKGFTQLYEYGLSVASLNPKKKHIKLKREIFHCADSVLVLVYVPKIDSVVLCQEFRIGVFANGSNDNSFIFECVAGTIDKNNTPEEIAKAEVREETGLEVCVLQQIAVAYSSPGRMTEKTYIYYAETKEEPKDDGIYGLENEGEEIVIHTIKREDIYKMMDEMKILDSMTLMALNWFRAKHG